MLLEFALGNNLKVMSTQFQHKKIHKGTWLAPDQKTLNQIDQVTTSSEKKELMEDVRTVRGPNIDSDHYRLKITLNLPKIYIKRNRDWTGTLDKSNLENPIKLLEYRERYTPYCQNIHNRTKNRNGGRLKRQLLKQHMK